MAVIGVGIVGSGGILTRSEGCESRIPSRLDMQLSL